MEKALFIVIAVLAVAGALNIIVQRNPLYGAMSLVGTLVAVSALYVTLQAHFIAAIQVVVYAGAIMVLFVFVIMLLNVPKEGPTIDKQKSLKYLALPFAALLLYESMYVIQRVRPIAPPLPSGAPDRAVGTTFSVGLGLFTDYLLPFEVTSVLILMAIVGAMVLARRENP